MREKEGKRKEREKIEVYRLKEREKERERNNKKGAKEGGTIHRSTSEKVTARRRRWNDAEWGLASST